MNDTQAINFTIGVQAGTGAVVLNQFFTTLNQQTVQASNNAKNANQSFGAWLKTASSIAVIFSAGMTAVSAFFGVIKSGIGIMQPFANALEGFEEHMNGIKALTTSTEGVVSPLYQKLKQQALDYAGTSKYTATQIAEAQKLIIRAGMNEEQTLRIIPVAANMSMASAGSNLETTTRTLMKAIQTFHVPLKDIAKVGDEITVAVNKSAMNMEDLDTAFKTAGGTAQQFGGDLENMLAFMASVSNEGVRGTQVGTGYRNMFIRLQTATGGAYTELKRFGLEAADVSTLGKQLEEVMTGLSDQHASPVEMLKILKERAGGVALSFMSQGIPAFQAMKKAIEDSGGAAERAAKIQMEGFYGSIMKMRGGLEKAAITIGSIFEPQMTSLANLFNNVANKAASFAEKLQIQTLFTKLSSYTRFFLDDTKGAFQEFGATVGSGLDYIFSKIPELCSKVIIEASRYLLMFLRYIGTSIVDFVGSTIEKMGANAQEALRAHGDEMDFVTKAVTKYVTTFGELGRQLKQNAKDVSDSPLVGSDFLDKLSKAQTEFWSTTTPISSLANWLGITSEKFGEMGAKLQTILPSSRAFFALFSTPEMPKLTAKDDEILSWLEDVDIQLRAELKHRQDIQAVYKRDSENFVKALNYQKFEKMIPQGDNRLGAQINLMTETAQTSFDAMAQGNERTLTAMTNSTRRYVGTFRQIWFEKNKGQINSDEATSRTSIAVGASLLEGLFQLTVKNGRKRWEILKAAKIAEALANTYTAVTGAYTAVPWPFNIAAAAAQLAAGLAQVNAIRSLDYASASGSSSVSGSGGSSGGSGGGGSLSDTGSSGSSSGGPSLTQVDNGRGRGNRNITINVDGFVGNSAELASKIGEIIKEGVRDNIDFGLVNSGG